MDKDTFSRDDFIGKVCSLVLPFFLTISSSKASLKLSEVDKSGNATKLKLVKPSDGETHLSFSQTTAIYNLFAALDPENTGKIPSETKDLVVKSASREAVLLTELKAFIDEKKETNGDGEVSFEEFLEAFRVHEDAGTTEHINKLAEAFKLLKAA